MILRKLLPPKVEQVSGLGDGLICIIPLQQVASVCAVATFWAHAASHAASHSCLPWYYKCLLPSPGKHIWLMSHSSSLGIHSSLQVVFCKLSPLQYKLYKGFQNSAAVQALLSGQAEKASRASGGPRAAKRLSNGSTKKAAAAAGDPSAAAAAGDLSQHQESDQQQKKPTKQPQLLPLAAITNLKKLCCHPDLVFSMTESATGTAAQPAQRQSWPAPASAAGGFVKRRCTQPQHRTAYCESNDGGSGSSSSAARQQLTGFEGLQHLFQEGDVTPPYHPGQCQAWHSGVWLPRQPVAEAKLTHHMLFSTGAALATCFN